MSSPIHVVTVDSSTETAKALISTVIKNLKGQYNLVHVANCESEIASEDISHVKAIIGSLVTPPHVLITTSAFFEDEQEEVREIVQRVLPNTHLISIPPGLKAQEGDKKAEEYLADQITELKPPTSS